MKPLIIAATLALTACSTVSAPLDRVRTAAGYAVEVSEYVCPLVTVEPSPAPRIAKACVALAPLLPMIRVWLPAKEEPEG